MQEAVPTLRSIVPCFIVESLQSSLDFYRSKLGFEIAYKGGGNGDGEDFWAFVWRDGVMVSFKAIAPEIHPQPNHSAPRMGALGRLHPHLRPRLAVRRVRRQSRSDAQASGRHRGRPARLRSN
jgi:catechol 2,3-dioxygenase-like lactoylglutathione lyase family enzyme